MKLYELTGVRALRDKDLTQLLNDISGEGSKFKKAGEGVAAQVLVHSDGTIYKFWAKDSGYESFIEFVEKNKDNPHLPKLKSKVKELSSFFKKPESFPEKIKYVKMEKLTPIKYHTLFEDSKIAIVDVIRMIYFGATGKYHRSEIKPEDALDWILNNLIQDNKGQELSKKALDIVNSLFKTIQKMNNDIPDFKKFGNDMHHDNIMLRGETIVITDPLADDKEVDFNSNLRFQIDKLNKELNPDNHKKLGLW